MGGPNKGLYRSRADRKIAGVGGGLAAYLGIDPVRPGRCWVDFALGGGRGILAYLVCWLVIPLEPVPVPGWPRGSSPLDERNGARIDLPPVADLDAGRPLDLEAR